MWDEDWAHHCMVTIPRDCTQGLYQGTMLRDSVNQQRETIFRTSHELFSTKIQAIQMTIVEKGWRKHLFTLEVDYSWISNRRTLSRQQTKSELKKNVFNLDCKSRKCQCVPTLWCQNLTNGAVLTHSVSTFLPWKCHSLFDMERPKSRFSSANALWKNENVLSNSIKLERVWTGPPKHFI